MSRLRLVQAAHCLSTKCVTSTRGIATYEYRKYGDADGPNYHLVQYLTQGVFVSTGTKQSVTPTPYLTRSRDAERGGLWWTPF
jgi:hypothetical protein